MTSAREDRGPILVGVDFSPGSEEAFAWAIDAAIAFDARLIALHVIHDPAESPGYYARADGGRSEDFEHVAEEMMAEFLVAARARLPRLDQIRSIESVVVVGLPVTRIIEIAEREGAHHIVMGAQGRSALADAILGSKVERVVRLSPVPVTVVKPARAEDAE